MTVSPLALLSEVLRALSCDAYVGWERRTGDENVRPS